MGPCGMLLLMKSKRTKLFWGIWCVGVALGLTFSFQRTSRVNELKRVHRDVKAKAGLLRVDDPTKVYVTAVISPVIPAVLQKETVRVWQFQVYLPVGYATQVLKLSGPITKDGARNRGGHSSSSSTAKKEAVRGLWTLTLHEEDGQWKLSSSQPSGSGQMSLRIDGLASIDDLIVKTICPEPGQTVEIEPDQFFNLIRIRKAEKAPNRKNRKQDLDLYAGSAMWIGPKDSRAAFDAVSDGGKDPNDLAKVMLNE